MANGFQEDGGKRLFVEFEFDCIIVFGRIWAGGEDVTVLENCEFL